MIRLFEFARPAMGSLFQLRLVGDDAEHLAAVAEAAFDEIERVERLLSWRDARSETSRINREAGDRPVRIDVETCALLAVCIRGTEQTDGYFNVVRPRSPGPSPNDAPPREELGLALDVERRLVRLAGAEASLDFGAFGKGYALDRAAVELRRYGVRAALVDGGGSSVLALGDDDGKPWLIGLRNPFSPRPDRRETWSAELHRLPLVDAAFSCSATVDEFSPATTSDLVDPHTGRPLLEVAACGVVAPSAATAEILSTALVCMGKARAGAYTRRSGNDLLAAATTVVWIAEEGGLPRVETLLNRAAE